MTTLPDMTEEDWLELSDVDMPGMWTHSDFLGGDPDERSYAERARQEMAEVKR